MYLNGKHKQWIEKKIDTVYLFIGSRFFPKTNLEVSLLTKKSLLVLKTEFIYTFFIGILYLRVLLEAEV